ncbi:MAG: tetratricopeptide repeat protein, partial [Desulfovibrio sp.]|nr:tetratricopeptide repeat protein [Desulfovibrio sp.]
LVQRALDLYEKADGRQSLGVSTCLNNLGRIYENMGDSEKGVKLLKESAQIRQDLLGVHPDTAFSLLNYGTGLAALGHFGEASEALARCQAVYRELGMEESPYAKACAENLAHCRKEGA